MTTPGAQITINDSNYQAPPNATGLGLLLIGPATDGQPNTPLTISSPQNAINQLKGGDLCQGCLNAFNPSDELKGVSSLTVIRTDPATQATSAIGTVIGLVTTGYGTQANLSKQMVQAGSVSGYKVSLASDFVGPGGQTYPTVPLDNIGLSGISIYYSGAGTTPKYTVSDSALVLTATGSETGGTIAFTSTMTVQQLVNLINGFPGWSATVLDPNSSNLVTAYFDNVSTATVVGTTSPTAVTLTANAFAVVAWINSTGPYFTAVRNANPVTIPTSSSWTYATGGTTPTATNSNWSAAYTTAQSLTGIAVVTPVIGSAAIWAMNDAHCAYMTSLNQKRVGYLGDILAQSQAAEQANVLALNSCYTSLVWPEQKKYDMNGNFVLMAPYLMACAIAGVRAGNPPPAALTGASIVSSGMGVVLTPAQVAAANAAGICCFMQDTTGAVVISWDRTTWLQGTQYDKVENMSAVAEAIIISDLLPICQSYVGPPPTLQRCGHLQGNLFSQLTNEYQNGLLAAPPIMNNISVTVAGQVYSVSVADCEIIVPGNYVGLTLNATAFSGSVGGAT